MKKILTLVLAIGLTVSSAYSIPNWLFWTCNNWTQQSPCGNYQYDHVTGLMKGTTTLCGTSWLFGANCGCHDYDCYANQSIQPIIDSLNNINNYATNVANISAEMQRIANLGIEVDPLFTVTANLMGDEQLLIDAITFRLELAGYDVDPIWFTMEDAPCPMPQPTLPVVVPQIYQYVNFDCMTFTVSPNPNNGLFSLDLYEMDISIIDKIVITDLTAQNHMEITTIDDTQLDVDISSWPSGTYWVILSSGYGTKTVVVQKN